jgi:hypothetical protein
MRISDTEKNHIVNAISEIDLEAVPKLQFWNSKLKIRSFARLKA